MSTPAATYLTLKEVADINGVSRQAVADWLARRDLYRYPYRIKRGKGHLIRLDAAERYAEGRIGSKYTGYVTLKGLCQDAELNITGSFVRVTMVKGLEPKIFRGATYLSPEDAATFRARWKAFQPAHGWVPVRDSAPVIGRTRQGLTHWAKRNDVELRLYYAGGQVRQFIEERQLLTYVRLCTRSGRAPR